jgi:hypothetical protein
LIATLILFLQAAVPEGAATAPQANRRALCQAFEHGASEPGQWPREGATLYVGCGSSAVRIGRVESYRSSYHPGTGSLAVVVQEIGRTRILVAQQEADGALQMQDMTRDLAKATSRPFDAGLRGVEIDLGRFAEEGSIAAPALGRPGSEGRLTPAIISRPAEERLRLNPQRRPRTRRSSTSGLSFFSVLGGANADQKLENDRSVGGAAAASGACARRRSRAAGP